MRAGPLDQRVVIQTPTYAASTQSGQGAPTFSTLDIVWGSVKALSSDEALQGQTVGAQTDYEVAVRHRTDVTPKMRVQWTPYTGSVRTFEVHGVVFEDRRADRLVLRCGEVL